MAFLNGTIGFIFSPIGVLTIVCFAVCHAVPAHAALFMWTVPLWGVPLFIYWPKGE